MASILSRSQCVKNASVRTALPRLSSIQTTMNKLRSIRPESNCGTASNWLPRITPQGPISGDSAKNGSSLTLRYLTQNCTPISWWYVHIFSLNFIQCNMIQILLKFLHSNPFNTDAALFQIMAWRRTCPVSRARINKEIKRRQVFNLELILFTTLKIIETYLLLSSRFSYHDDVVQMETFFVLLAYIVWCAPKQTIGQIFETPVIWDAMPLNNKNIFIQELHLETSSATWRLFFPPTQCVNSSRPICDYWPMRSKYDAFHAKKYSEKSVQNNSHIVPTCGC